VAREEKGRQRQFGKCNHWFDGRTMKSNDDEKTKIFSLKKMRLGKFLKYFLFFFDCD
jgi:hypothetical protein